MAVDEEDTEVNLPLPDPPTRPPPVNSLSEQFVEVICRSSGKTRRFAAGTEASFAVDLINRKLDGGPLAWHIEAAKEGEEPISFGPTSVLVNYGDGWHLQTIVDPQGCRKERLDQPATRLFPPEIGAKGSHSVKPVPLQPVISFLYVGKILLAFVLIFALGAALTLALENLPRLILYINSSL